MKALRNIHCNSYEAINFIVKKIIFIFFGINNSLSMFKKYRDKKN